VKTLDYLDTLTDQATWTSSLLNLPDPHVLQSWTWGELKASQGWQCNRFAWRDDGRVVAAAQVLVQEQGRLRLGYIPKGPILDWSDQALVAQVCSDLATFAEEHRLLLLKIDPDVRADTDAGQAVRTYLERQHWRTSFEQIQFRNTMVLDLRPDLDTLMAEMKSKWRYNIRLAVRKGVEVREGTEADFHLMYEMYDKTASRNNFIIRERDYYLEAWRRFLDADRAIPLLASVDDTPVAMAILFHFGEWGWYMYGASRTLHRNHMPNHLLQWEAIRHLKDRGCTAYDLWGAPDELDEDDPMWGVYRFKQGFGAEFVPHIGAYDYAPRTWLYRFYAFVRPHLVALAQRRYWAQQ
jgi:lipid II:glycine glycyltransferase (peptidoglycan interpeptide bridge formation enzyme)